MKKSQTKIPLIEKKGKFFFFFCLFFYSCCLPTQESLKKKAEKIEEAMVEELKEVSCKEELIEKIPCLKRNYVKLAKILSQVPSILVEDPSYKNPKPSKISYELYREFLRIYEISGGKEILERIQKETVLYLPKEPLVEKDFSQEAS